MRLDAGWLLLRIHARPLIAGLCATWLALGCHGNDGPAPRNEPVEAGTDANVAAPLGDAGSQSDANQQPDAGGHDLIPCGDVTSNGRCASSTHVEVCLLQTGSNGSAHLTGYDCKEGEACDDTGTRAHCKRVSECMGGDTACADATTLKTCAAGAWSTAACDTRCVDSALGATCAVDVPTQVFTGTVRYEARTPNPGLTDWSAAPTLLPARHVSVLSYAADQLLDATYTDDTGAFSLLGTQTATSADSLVVVAAGIDAQRQLAFAVANAGYSSSPSALREPFDAAPDPSLWSWSIGLDTFSSGSPITISEHAGSGAARVFDSVRAIFSEMEANYAPASAQTVIVWTSPGTRWNCGACMASLPVELADQTFVHQVWLDGGSEDQGYWSDAVSAHELGHYVMSAFGYPPAEGGPHYLGGPTQPGLAWSEGWATFFSSMHRDSNLYYDKQGGTFFWFDLAQRKYAIDGVPWIRPSPDKGLDQLIDENEVAALLRETQLSIGEKKPMLTALADDRVRKAPFERGYTLRDWSDPDHPEDFEASSQSIPQLADYLDALRCDNAISAAALDLITEPTVHYPYPSGSPLCR